MVEEEKNQQGITPSFPVQLFHKKQRGEITQEKFDQELAYWTMQTALETMTYRPMPIPPPDMKEYLALPEHEKRNVNSDFWKQEDIKTYKQLRDEAKMENSGVYRSLVDMLKKIPETDEESRGRVSGAIAEFELRQRIDDDLMRGYRREDTFRRPKHNDNWGGYTK